MSVYIPVTPSDRAAMLEHIGIAATDGLFADIPDEIKLGRALKLDEPMSEYELSATLAELAGLNRPAAGRPCFLGAGAYDRLIPSAVRHMTSRSEFYTAYTPYQAEISQGTLQAIFEFQTMIASLTGMDVANASMYDGASACAEAVIMASRVARRNRVLVAETIHPDTREVINTYARFNDIDIEYIPSLGGVVDVNALAGMISKEVAGVVVQSPNFFGLIENVPAIADMAHSAHALAISYVSDALSLAVLKSPGAAGADIAVGEGQSFGIPMSYGGPWLGFMAVKQALMRKLPGRIAGETVDVDGRRAFVLTLQAREQHIRREKATSNICSNQGLNALSATIYLSLLGADGLAEAAKRSMDGAHYLQKKLEAAGFPALYEGPFFDEFAFVLPQDPARAETKLRESGIIGGFQATELLPKADVPDGGRGVMLVCVTEKRSKKEIDDFVSVLSAAYA